MKDKIKKILIHSVPVFSALLLFFFSFSFVSAATFDGDWTFSSNVSKPTWTSVTINFTADRVNYTGMIYESYNETYGYPLITFTSDTVSRPAIYWRDGVSHFLDTAFQRITFNGFQYDQGAAFSNWMTSNARQGLITPESEAAGDLKDKVDGSSDRLEDANKFWEEIPQPSLSGDEYDFLIGQRPEYQKFMNFWTVAWQNSTLYEMMLALGGLMLASFLVFAGK